MTAAAAVQNLYEDEPACQLPTRLHVLTLQNIAPFSEIKLPLGAKDHHIKLPAPRPARTPGNNNRNHEGHHLQHHGESTWRGY